MSFPPHAFSPFLNPVDESDAFFDIWRNTGLKGQAYFAARNDAVSLIVAAQSNNLEMVQTLISRGVTIDEKGLEGETALHMGSALGYVDVVRTLIDAGSVWKVRSWT
ncbi:hypothetical protein VKT23_006581 [Stygiomarasmius scandens]|uniref:Uncharacterized protein n=1 Tax=Marasmiellus scandens TaxID=2682957 RepID=A0ABR1JRI6_9AGAR